MSGHTVVSGRARVWYLQSLIPPTSASAGLEALARGGAFRGLRQGLPLVPGWLPQGAEVGWPPSGRQGQAVRLNGPGLGEGWVLPQALPRLLDRQRSSHLLLQKAFPKPLLPHHRRAVAHCTSTCHRGLFHSTSLC